MPNVTWSGRWQERGSNGRTAPTDTGSTARLLLQSPQTCRSHHALDQCFVSIGALDERAADFQRAPDAVLGQVLLHGESAHSGSHREGGRGRKGHRHHAHLWARIRHHGGARRFRQREWRTRRARLSVVDDHSRFRMAFNGANVASLLRVGVRDQRRCLHRLLDSNPASGPRSRTHAAGLALDRSVDQGSSALSACERRSGQGIQRPAEARLPFDHLWRAAASDLDGAGDVPLARFGRSALG